jgi:hypothetical protein
MFSSPAASPTNLSPLPHSFHPNRCHPERGEGSAFRIPVLSALSVSAFSSPDVCSFNFKLSIACPERSRSACPERSRRVNFPSLSPFPATLTSPLQPLENTATLSPAFATLTIRIKVNPFVCHSYKKHPGWGSHLSNERVRRAPGSLSDQDSPNTNHNSYPLLVAHHSPPVAASALFLPPITAHQSQVTKSFIIRTYRKCSCNSFRIRTSKTQHLKPFRMNTYKKTGEGVVWAGQTTCRAATN